MYITNMKYNKTASIIGQGGKVIGRMPRDRVKSVGYNRSGIRVDTRKGTRFVWFFARPFRVLVANA